VLREALARDEVQRTAKLKKVDSARKAGAFIQNIHHFRDEALRSPTPPTERVAIFDEAQRAWDVDQASKFMKTKRGQIDFDMSEPEFLISIMDRHDDWAVIVALVGGGQEINTGEAGIVGWQAALESRFPNWNIFYSDQINHEEYASGKIAFRPDASKSVTAQPELHLSVSMRSFRAQSLSAAIHHVVGGKSELARQEYERIQSNYSIVVARNLDRAKNWIRAQRRGLDSSGMLVSSGADRLRPVGMIHEAGFDVPVWFLNPIEDVRSSGFLELAASEFDVQGLELDWTIVGWDGDFRFNGREFEHWDFSGTRWNGVRKVKTQRYLENKYRVLLTRARQGMVIVVPEGDTLDHTRSATFYDATYAYLLECGFSSL
jgi:hypothetical protein